MPRRPLPVKRKAKGVIHIAGSEHCHVRLPRRALHAGRSPGKRSEAKGSEPASIFFKERGWGKLRASWWTVVV